MFPLKGPVKTHWPIQRFFEEDENILHNYQDLKIIFIERDKKYN